MDIPFFSQLIFIFKLLFMSSKDLKDTKKHDINFALIVACLIIFIAIIWFYVSFISNISLTADNKLLIDWDKLWTPAIIGFVFIVTYILSTILIINRLLKDNKIEIEIPTCENKVCSLVNEIYPHAKGYISRHFSVLYDSHEKFAKDIAMINGIDKTELTDVAKDAENSIHGRFLCVLSDTRYYPTNDKTINTSQEAKDLIDYFIRFEKHTDKNHITRIFTWNENATDCSKKIFLQYLLSNNIAGMDTYVLFSGESISTGLEVNASSKYFPYIDYVISDILNKDTHNRETKVYFSCDVSETEPDKVIVSKDNFLLHLLETDFANRLGMRSGQNAQSHCIKLSQATYRSILEDIGLVKPNANKNTYTTDEKNEVNNTVSELANFINSLPTHTANANSKKKLKAKLNSWNIK